MAVSYTVKSGDSLSKIAAKFGVKSWQTIYNAPENAAFRKRRPNPDLIFPGDVLFIPGATAKDIKLCNQTEPRLNPLAAASFVRRVR